VIFYPFGVPPELGTAGTDAVISADRMTVQGTIPLTLVPGFYGVTTREVVAGDLRFSDIEFFVEV